MSHWLTAYRKQTEAAQSSVHLSSLTDWVVERVGGHEGRLSRDPLLGCCCFAGGLCEPFWHGQGCQLFDVVHPAFHLPTTPSPTLQGALNDATESVLERLPGRVTCPNHASFCHSTVARRGSCGPTKKLILFRTQSLVLCSKYEMRGSFLGHLVSKA